MRTLSLAILCVACQRISVAQASAPVAELACVEALELPTRSILSSRAVTSGTVVAVIEIGSDGKLSKLEMRGENAVLKGEVGVAMSLSQFATRCTGRKVEFIFAFRLEDPPTDSILPPGVRYTPPNRFDLAVRRVKPNIDPAPTLPKE